MPTLSGVGRARWLAAALDQAPRAEEAQQALGKAIAMGATFDMYVRRRVPWDRAPKNYEHMLDGLRKAGWQG